MRTITKSEQIDILNSAIYLMDVMRLLGFPRDFKTALILKLVAATAEKDLKDIKSMTVEDYVVEYQAVFAINEIVVKD